MSGAMAVHDATLEAGGDDWTAADIIRHMRAADAIISHRLWAMLVRDDAPLIAYDEREWGLLIAAAEMVLVVQVESLRLRRVELLAMLKSLTDDAWSRTAAHETRGEMKLLDVAHMLAEHEVEHCLQLDALSTRPAM